MPEQLQYVEIPEPETTGEAPRRLSPWLRILWVASIVGFVASVVAIYVMADKALYESNSPPLTVIYLVGQAVLQVSVFGVLLSAALTWWERRPTSTR